MWQPIGARRGLPLNAGSVDELVEQPARPDDLSVHGSDLFGQSTVRRDHDRVTIGLGDGGDRVVALAGRMHNLHARPRPATSASSAPARPSALGHDGHGWVQPSRVHRRPRSFREDSWRLADRATSRLGETRSRWRHRSPASEQGRAVHIAAS